MAPVPTGHLLARLREEMKRHSLDAYLVPSEDAHSSEYIAPSDMRRQFISGFSGSAGFALITAASPGRVLVDSAGLWTDGRYWLQASNELDANWTLVKQGAPGTPSREDWLNTALPREGRLGVDPQVLSTQAADILSKGLSQGRTLVSVEENLVDLVWGADRPPRPCQPLRILPLSVTGDSVRQKLTNLRSALASRKGKDGNATAGFLVTALDDIAWLFNLRGADIEFNPVFFAYAYVSMDTATLYTDNATMTPELAAHFDGAVDLKPYAAISADVKALAARLRESNSSVSLKESVAPSNVLIGRNCPWSLAQELGSELTEEAPSPISNFKAIKNAAELEGMREAHIRDAVALCTFFSWLEGRLAAGDELDEIKVAYKLNALRTEQKDFVGPSFETISASGPNAAIVHYRATPETCRPITPSAMFLCDSGGQYVGGTTDVTRTLHFGTPTAHEINCFTRVLQGHIALDSTQFPTGVSGYQLDAIARRPLWRAGLDYRHGTGHGVGAFLNVHEGPHGIGTRIVLNETSLQAGMIVTNEPGYYEAGNFGIRIENVVVIKDAGTFGGQQFLAFEPLTLVPMQRKLIETTMLNPDEIAWLNDYHARCRSVVGQRLDQESAAYKWLARETEPI